MGLTANRPLASRRDSQTMAAPLMFHSGPMDYQSAGQPNKLMISVV